MVYSLILPSTYIRCKVLTAWTGAVPVMRRDASQVRGALISLLIKAGAAMLSLAILLPNIAAADQFKNSLGQNGDGISTTATGFKNPADFLLS